MASVDPLTTGFLLVEELGSGDPVWAVKWRSADGTRVRRRLGARAWVERDAGGGWRPRGGRPREGWLTEFQARRRMPAFVEAAETELAAARARTAVAAVGFEPTFRALAHAWLEHLE
ncbi:MAG: site-specific integrase, partial [Acidobacteria bacterium]|nr:site-specific integrase [Acidobacteriota bacterium]